MHRISNASVVNTSSRSPRRHASDALQPALRASPPLGRPAQRTQGHISQGAPFFVLLLHREKCKEAACRALCSSDRLYPLTKRKRQVTNIRLVALGNSAHTRGRVARATPNAVLALDRQMLRQRLAAAARRPKPLPGCARRAVLGRRKQAEA